MVILPHLHDKKEVSVTDRFTTKGFADYRVNFEDIL
jgi:hypothetical protein